MAVLEGGEPKLGENCVMEILWLPKEFLGFKHIFLLRSLAHNKRGLPLKPV